MRRHTRNQTKAVAAVPPTEQAILIFGILCMLAAVPILSVSAQLLGQ